MAGIDNLTFPSKVRIVEVGPRDGLQNEPPDTLPLETRIEFINLLSVTGLTHIEVTSFVSPDWIPGMVDSDALFKEIERNPKVVYSALTPNLKGFLRAMDAGVDQAVIFTSATETFAQKNINCSIAESFKRFKPIIDESARRNVPVRGYISVTMGCPYEGDVAPDKVADVAKALYELGCCEVSLCDTIGTGNPALVKKMIGAVTRYVPIEKLAAHFHDTFGMGLVNLYAAIEKGVSVVDSSTGGLGGCPYAVGDSDNVATEDIVYMLDLMGIETGVDLNKIIRAGNFISEKLGRRNASKVACAKSANKNCCSY
jgi:hydroxymethylglutaryl-CoA lyase